MATTLLGSNNNVGTDDFFATGNTGGCRYQAVASGTLDTIRMIFRIETGMSTLKLGIYSDSAGVPSALLGSASVSGDITSAGEKFVTGLSVSITSGTFYHLAVTGTGSNVNFTGPSGAYRENVGTAGNFEDPWTTVGDSTGVLNVPIWGESSSSAVIAALPHRMPLGV